MSIIADALKKAERERSGKKEDLPLGIERFDGPYRQATQKKRPWLFASYVVFVIVGVSVAGLALFKEFANIRMYREVISPQSPAPATEPDPAIVEKGDAKNESIATEIPPETSRAIKDERALLPPQPAIPAPSLNGIMYLVERPLAIINGKTVQEGDSIDGMQIVKILPDRVLLQYNGEEITLTLR